MSEKGVSYSEISTYQECAKKHDYAYNERLHKISYSQSSRMNIGIVVHECLDACLHFYLDTDYTATLGDIENVIEKAIIRYSEANKPMVLMVYDGAGFVPGNLSELEQWDVDVALAGKIAYRTIEYLEIPLRWRTEFVTWNGERVPIIEFKFDYPIIPEKDLIGKIDWVARNLEDGQVYLIDWKTRKIFSDDFEINGEDMNLQMSLYQYVLNSLGLNIFGTITYQIRSDIPHLPEITKSGKMSRAKITTDWKTYEDAVKANGENPEEYREMLEKLPHSDYWWLPVFVIRGQHELHARWKIAQQITTQIVNDQQHIKYESPRCNYCPYFRLCLGEDRGMDIESLKQTNYTTEQRH